MTHMSQSQKQTHRQTVAAKAGWVDGGNGTGASRYQLFM